MAVFFESQVYAECDGCRTHCAESGITVKDFKAKLRKEGWSFGKRTLCLECRMRAKKGNRGENNATYGYSKTHR